MCWVKPCCRKPATMDVGPLKQVAAHSDITASSTQRSGCDCCTGDAALCYMEVWYAVKAP